MKFICPDCGYEDAEPGNCPECETPLLKSEGEGDVEEKEVEEEFADDLDDENGDWE